MEKKTSWLDRLMLAITFAEANEHSTARTYLEDRSKSEHRQYTCITSECVMSRGLRTSRRPS